MFVVHVRQGRAQSTPTQVLTCDLAGFVLCSREAGGANVHSPCLSAAHSLVGEGQGSTSYTEPSKCPVRGKTHVQVIKVGAPSLAGSGGRLPGGSNAH